MRDTGWDDPTESDLPRAVLDELHEMIDRLPPLTDEQLDGLADLLAQVTLQAGRP